MKKLTKSNDRVIAGVCAGISEYINPELDPVIIRVFTLVFGILNPIVWAFYLIFAIALPGPQCASQN